MRRPARTLTEQDQAIWAFYAAQVRTLPGHTAPLPPPAPEMSAPGASVPVPAAPGALPAPKQPGRRPGMLIIGQPPAGVDKATWQRLRTNRMPIGRRVDLHGHTAQRAYDRFEQVLTGAAAQGTRCIEIITGRGAGEAGGVLRREFPLWLNLPHLRPLILAAVHPHALNDGAVLLLLRRPGRGA